jgi:hypothetical protein
MTNKINLALFVPLSSQFPSTAAAGHVLTRLGHILFFRSTDGGTGRYDQDVAMRESGVARGHGTELLDIKPRSPTPAADSLSDPRELPAVDAFQGQACGPGVSAAQAAGQTV